MRVFLQKKLWRDKAVDLMEQNHGSKINWHRLNDQEFDQEIRIKLLEETQEVVTACNTKELVSELADVYEVLSSLCALHEITQDEILKAKIDKYNERGGFEGRKFVETAEHPEGNFGEIYCLNDSKKYPEVIK